MPKSINKSIKKSSIKESNPKSDYIKLLQKIKGIENQRHAETIALINQEMEQQMKP